MYGTGFFPSEKSDYYSSARGRALPRRDVRGAADRDAHGRDPRASCRSATARSRPASAASRARRAATRAACSACTSSRRSRWSCTSRPEESWDEHERLLAHRGGARAGGRAAVPRRQQRGGRPLVARRRSATTSRRGSRRRSGIARSRRARTRPTTRRAARASVSARSEGQLETPHTLNGTAVTDRWALAILENFGGDVPEVLQGYGAPERVTK